MKRHFIIDASALAPFILPSNKISPPEIAAKKAIVKLLAFRDAGRCCLYVPNFCMAECSKVFASVCFAMWKNKTEATENYHKYIELLINIVSSVRKGLIQSLNLERKHLVDIEAVFKAEHELISRGSEGPLSGFDALIVAMGKELVQLYGRDAVFIVTADRKMAKVCNYGRSHGFPNAICLPDDPIPDGK